MNYSFKLDKYFDDFEYRIGYLDILIKNSKCTKESLLKQLEIPYASYSRVKTTNSRVSREIIRKLEEHFNINSLDRAMKNEYQSTINRIIYKVYYRGDGLSLFENTLKSYIKRNDCLQPIFKLLLVYIHLSFIEEIGNLRDKLKDEMLELREYKKIFNESPFWEMYTVIELMINDKKTLTFKNKLSISKDMRGVYYLGYLLNAFINGSFDIALYYAQEAKKYLYEDYNFRRILLVNVVEFICLNIHNEYERCYNESKSQLIYLLQNYDNKKLINTTRSSLYISCIGMGHIDEVLDVLKDNRELDAIDYIHLVIASRIKGIKPHNDILDLYYKNKTKLAEVDCNNIDSVISYLRKPDQEARRRISASSIQIDLKHLLLSYNS